MSTMAAYMPTWHPTGRKNKNAYKLERGGGRKEVCPQTDRYVKSHKTVGCSV